MIVLIVFLRYALVSIGWEVDKAPARLVVTDLHVHRYTIVVTPCE